MAGRRDTSEKTTSKKSSAATAKKSKNPEPEVVSDAVINDAVVADSEESDSFDVSLKSELQKQANAKKIEGNQSSIRSRNRLETERPNGTIKKKKTLPEPEPEPEPESESETDEEVAESEEAEADVEESDEGEEVVEDSEGEEEVEESDGEEADEENVKKQMKIEKTNGQKKVNQNGNGKMSDKKQKGKEKETEKSESALYKLPMRRISRIIKSENADMRISHEATFLINKATEKFLELFAKEAYACAFLERKNQVTYNHLSSVVAKRQRFDFLSDFVPEQIKAEDALAELSMSGK